MYPANKRDALLDQLQTEQALRDLTMAAYEYWLPFVERAVFPSLTADAAPPPDPNGVGETEDEWEFGLDHTLMLGLGLIYGYEWLRAYRALGGEVPPVPDAPAPTMREAPDAARPVPRQVIEPPRIVTPQQQAAERLENTTRRIVARSLNIETSTVATLQQRLAAIPSVRELQSAYLAQVRNRMVGVPDSVFRDIARDIDTGLANGDGPDDMAKSVQKYLDITTGDWRNRAITVARTESAGAMSAATVEAAQLRNVELGEDLHQVWLCTIDSKTRRSHFAADGQRVTLGAKFKVGRADLRFPADPRGPANETINCRCRVAVLAGDESLPIEGGRARRAEVQRRADDGVIRARDDDDGVGIAAAGAHLNATLSDITAQARDYAKALNGKPYKYGRRGMDLRTELSALLERFADAPVTEDVPAIEPPADEPAPPAPATDGETYQTFTAVLAVIGEPTDDGRILATGIDFRFREFPLPLRWQKQSSEQHFASYTVGVIESAELSGTQVIGSGYFLNTPEAEEAKNEVAHKVTGPSVDLADVTWILVDEAGNEVSEEQWLTDPSMPVMEAVTSALLTGATLVAIPAFGTTSITPGPDEPRTITPAAALVASAPPAAITKYPDEFFTNPQLDGPTLPTMTADGRIYGHLASFNTCHVGIQDRCVMAPRSVTDYAMFHTAPPVLTESGKRVKVGRLTVGGGHAAPHLRMGPAVAHYDDAGTCFALVHVGEDAHGVWFSGVPAPGVTADQLAQGMSAPLSGDWRTVGGNLELVAALAVNTPGFPILASGATDENQDTLSLVASLGPCPEEGKDVLTTDQVAELGAQMWKGFQAAQRRQAEAARLVASLNAHEARKLIEGRP